jgi:hypothetical protein
MVPRILPLLIRRELYKEVPKEYHTHGRREKESLLPSLPSPEQ